jgi:hypothetical protein
MEAGYIIIRSLTVRTKHQNNLAVVVLSSRAALGNMVLEEEKLPSSPPWTHWKIMNWN